MWKSPRINYKKAYCLTEPPLKRIKKKKVALMGFCCVRTAPCSRQFTACWTFPPILLQKVFLYELGLQRETFFFLVQSHSDSSTLTSRDVTDAFSEDCSITWVLIAHCSRDVFQSQCNYLHDGGGSRCIYLPLSVTGKCIPYSVKVSN